MLHYLLVFHKGLSEQSYRFLFRQHTEPSGNFVDDWRISGHIFKLTRGDGENVCRDWLCRTSLEDNCLRRKMFCPQVGDSVVYIPRAHHDTLLKFPAQGNPQQPWKSWPTASSWPVVRCVVKHVRYRFPYEKYYKSRQGDRMQGVVAVLTLEITGVPPQPGHRQFPWPAPSFLSCPCESMQLFEISLHKTNEDDFLIPECLYLWRIKKLERAIVSNGNAHGLLVRVFCEPDNDNRMQDTDDVNREAFTGCLTQTNESYEDELHFVDSGYHALTITWDDNNELAVYSVWDVEMIDPSSVTPTRPILSADVMREIKRALRDAVNLDPGFNELFRDPVDTSSYTDYLDMVEVP